MALKLIQCDHCGFKFKIDLERQLEEGETTAVRSVSNFLKPKIRHVKSIDIQCAKCNKFFEYKLES